jgi:hypothetical protein
MVMSSASMQTTMSFIPIDRDLIPEDKPVCEIEKSLILISPC